MTVQYWLDQVFPNVKDANGKIVQWLTPWCYEVRMDWSNYSDFQRDSTKVYEDEYVSNWDVSGKALVPSGYTAAREKARAIDCHNSNKYNITQSIAEAFEIFCDYDYKCDAAGRFIGEYTDEKGNVWTGRKALFYNQAISQENPLHIYYQKNLQSISRAAESEELFTKLFVTPIESSSMENGYVTIADTMANPTLDDFLLNFDYLYSVNSISEYQMQFVKEYEASIRSLNLKLLHASPILNDLVAQINDQKAELAGLDKQVAAAKEQLTYYEKLRDNELTNGTVIKDKSNATSIIFTEDNGVYKAALRFEGIVKGTIRGYKDSAYDTLLFSADQLKEITDISSVGDAGYYVLLDEYGYPSYICSKKPDESLVYLSVEYSPTNKYETICQTFYNEIDLNTQRKTAIEGTISRLEENYTAQEEEYNNNLAAKEALNQKLERVLGPALREGYWTPDEYDDPGKQYIKQFTQPQFNSTLSETCFFYDSEPFDNEQLAYYYIGSSKTYYPYLRINSLINKWSDKNIDDLVIHLQRDFVGTMQSTTALTAGNYFFLCNNKKYYFSLTAAQIATGNTLTVRMSGTEVSLLLNGSTPIVLSSYLANASNLTSFFEGATENLADYYLYNNAGFVFAFMNIEGNICEPVLLFNNEDLADIYENYTRVAYSFVGENIVTSIQGYLTKNTSHELYYPRFYLAEDNVFSSSNLLTVALKKDEEEIILEKYYDYSILLRQGKTYITLKITSDNPIWKFVSNEYYYEVNYRSSLANDLLYLDAKEVAKENSQPKYSYDLSVAILPTQNGKMPEIKLGQLAYISDPILGVRAATGYVSEITFDLKKPQNDNIKIANYKTKFEDLFQTITASSEAMKNNQTSYDIAAGSFGPDGSISGDVIQTAINNNSFFFDYSATGVEIDPVNGIVLTNKKPYMNGVYGQVALQGGGIFLSSSIDPLTGERIWNTGITPNGINASIINAGQLNTNLIKIYSGDEMAFQWNSEGIYAYKFDDNGKAKNDTYIKYSQDGLHYTKEQVNEDGTRSNPLHIVSLDWDGLTLRNNQGQKTLSLEAETGDLLISGTMQSFNYSSGIIGTGWKIDQAGYAEFNDIFVRGTISAAVFEYKETSAVGGELYVAPTINLENDKTAGARFTHTEGAPLQIAINIPFNDDHELAGRVWQVGDLVSLNGIVLSNDETEKYEIKNLRMKVSSLGERTTLVTEAPIYSTTNTIFYDEKGNPIAMAAVNELASCKGSGKWHLIFLGSNGQREGILITAMANDGPYIDIYDDNPEKPNDKSPRVRLGKLDGLQNYPAIAALYPNINGYGLYSDNVYLKGAIYADRGRIGSLSIDEVENASDIVNNITTTNTSGQVIINKGALTADSISAGVITTNHLSSQVGEELELSSNKSIALIVDNIEKDYTAELEVTSEGIRAEVVNIQANLQSQITENKTSISQTSEEIKTEVTRATEAEGKLNSTISQTATEIRSEVSSSIEGVNSTISQTAHNLTSEISRIESETDSSIGKINTRITQTERDILFNVSETYTTKQNLNDTLNSYYTKTETDAAIKVSSDNIALSVSKTYTTKNEFNSALEDYSTKNETSAAIEVSSENILSAVKNTYTTKTDLNSTLKGYYTVTETNAAIETSKTGILTTVSNNYATIDSLGNYALTSWTSSQIDQSAKSITAKVESGDITSGKVKTSKITIDTNGVSIATGGTFTVTGNNFAIKADGSVEMKGKVTAIEGAIGGWTIGETSLHSGSSTSYVALSSDSNSDYRIWAGGEKPAEASFAVTKTGAVYLNKVYVQTGYDEGTKKYTYSTQSLSDYPLWAIWNAYNGNPVSMNYADGTLTLTTRGGKPLTANFNIAVGVGTDENGNIFAVDSNGKQVGTSKPVSLATNGTLSYTAGNTTALAYTNILLGGAVVRRDFTQVNVEPILNSVTVDTAEVDGTVTFTDTNYAQIPITVVTTNKLTYMTTLSVDCSDIYTKGVNSVTVDKIEITGKTWTVDQYAYANITATASNGKYKTERISIYANDIYKAGQDSCAITSISLSNQFQATSSKRVDFTATATGTNLDSFPVKLYVDASEIYEAGVTEGENKFEAGTYYRGNGGTKTAVGTPITPKGRVLYEAPKSGAASVMVYDVGTAAILYKKGDSFVARGNSITAYTKKTE